MSVSPELFPIAPSHDRLATFLLGGVSGEVQSVSIIGSYLIDHRLRPGSDIDTVIVVDDLEATRASFGDKIFYKNTLIEDSQGRRQEMNAKLDGVPVDITIIDPDSTNPPNNPLTDYYENFLGLCLSGYPIYGRSLKEVLKYNERVKHYDTIRDMRLRLVEEKIALTKQKITDQQRDDLHIIYELERYVFIRECIARRVFNTLSIKHPEKSVPDFNAIFEQDLADCGLMVAVSRTAAPTA